MPFLCIGFVILIMVLIANEMKKTEKQREQAKINYDDSLRMLKTNPTSADLRQKTLELGRQYSNLTRRKSGVAIFDEVALMNDINAACAGATVSHSPESSPPSKQPIEQRLRKLVDLKDKGLLTEQEYEFRKSKILDEV